MRKGDFIWNAVSPGSGGSGAQTASGFYTGNDAVGRVIATGFTAPCRKVYVVSLSGIPVGIEWNCIDAISPATGGGRTTEKRTEVGVASTNTEVSVSALDFVVNGPGGTTPNRTGAVYAWYATT